MSTVAHDLRRSFFVVATIAVLVLLQSLRVASAEPLAPSEPPNVGDAFRRVRSNMVPVHRGSLEARVTQPRGRRREGVLPPNEC
jgi:hypothetical protein